jgi:hypothetical protein
MTISTPEMKRGETFSYEAEVIADGQLLDVPVEAVRSQVRTKVGVLLGECVVEKISTGKFRFTIADTNSWPIGQVEFDFDITVNGLIESSPTFTKNILKDITRPIVEVEP